MNRPLYKPRTNVAALLALSLAIVTVLANVGAAYAATLTSASLALSDPRPTQTSQYTITANGFNTGQTIGCIAVDLGSAADGSGSVTSANTVSSTLVSQTITGSGTWSVDNTQSASQILRATNATPVAPQSGSQSITFGAVTNGATAGTTYYAVVTTYTTSACSTPVDTVTVTFVYTNGQSVTASVDPSLTFSVAGVANGATVNGATTTVTTTGTTIPFGKVTSGSNQIAGQDLTVSTNAGNGYTVYIRSTGAMSAAIPDFAAGTNAAPVAFSAPGTANFGYTTSSTTLSGTAGRFSSNKWAGLSTTNAEIAHSTAGISNDTTHIGYQVGIANTTAAGSYATTVIYTATPVY